MIRVSLFLIGCLLLCGSRIASGEDETIPAGKVTTEDFVPITQDSINEDPIDFSEQNQTVAPTQPIVPKGSYTVPDKANPSGQNQ